MERSEQGSLWLWLSLGVVVCLTLNTLLIAKLKEAGIKADVVALYWFLFVAVGLATALVLKGDSLLPPAASVPPQRWWPLLVLAGAGLVGTVANLCFFSAVFAAPNPGYVTAIRSCEAVLVAVTAVGLSGAYAQRYSLGILQLGGIVLIITGVALLSMRPT
jgi:hypothetical protein